MTELRIDGVAVAFDDTPVLRAVELTVADGEIVALLGPSGSGKSTLLRVVAGLSQPNAGRVFVGGIDVTNTPTHRRGVGMVFQDDQLFPHRDVASNVGFGLKMAGLPRSEIRRAVDEMLELVGLTGFSSRRVTDLSGGEAKRVALARALAASPLVLLLDEPLTGLDTDLHDRLAPEVRDLLRVRRMTAIHVTHDRNEANVVADRIVTLAEIDGSVGSQP